MTFEEFQKAARRTQNKTLDGEQMLHHALFGLGAEAGEILSIFQKELQGHEADRDKIVDECGDLLWMLSELADGCGINLDEIARHNVDKLWKRYPEGFDSVRSVNREE